METKTRPSIETAADSWNEGLTCWHTASGPQCLRVETTSEIHLFSYGYFQHAKLSHDGNKDVLQIQFQDQIIAVSGGGLEPMCDALERLAVDRIRIRPEKYEAIARDEGIIEDIQIKQRAGEIGNHLQ